MTLVDLTARRRKWLDLVCLAVAPLIGMGAVLLPVLAGAPVTQYDAPLFPVVRTAIENFQAPAIVCLAGAGLLLGVLSSVNPWLIGFALMALFPVITIAEIVADSRSHNLFPIELFSYVIMSFIGGIGAYVGGLMRRRMSSPPVDPDSATATSKPHV